MVCSQDGFHVMNGKDAINLVNEPNLICKTDYTKDEKDICPKKGFERPVPASCCTVEKPGKINFWVQSLRRDRF